MIPKKSFRNLKRPIQFQVVCSAGWYRFVWYWPHILSACPLDLWRTRSHASQIDPVVYADSQARDWCCRLVHWPAHCLSQQALFSSSALASTQKFTLISISPRSRAFVQSYSANLRQPRWRKGKMTCTVWEIWTHPQPGLCLGTNKVGIAYWQVVTVIVVFIWLSSKIGIQTTVHVLNWGPDFLR